MLILETKHPDILLSDSLVLPSWKTNGYSIGGFYHGEKGDTNLLYFKGGE